MRTVIYARVSTEDQGDNFSIPSQIAAARRYAADRGWQVVAELSDTMSGALLDRPALRQARDLIQARAVDAVIVYALDRLSRNVAHMLLLRDEMHSNNVQLHAVTRGQSADTAEGRLFDTIESAFAEFERLKITERSKRGKRQKLESGAIIGSGDSAPIGYRFAGSRRDKTLVVDESEAAWVRQIFTWASQGVPLCDIAARLRASGAPARRNGLWRAATVHRILRNPVYYGQAWSETYQIAVSVPAIVSEETWRAVQERLRLNQERAKRNATRVYALRTRVTCARCGAGVAGVAITRAYARYYYYRCAGAQRLRAGACEHPRYVRAERLEAAVWQWVVEHVLDETRLIEAIDRASAGEQNRRAELERERASYAAQIEDADRRIGKLVEAFTAGALTLDDLAAFKRRFEEQKESARRELARADALLADDRQRRIDRDAALALARQLRQMLPDSDITTEEQMRVYDALDLRVTLDADAMTARVSVTLTGDAGDVRIAFTRLLSRERNANILTLTGVIALQRAA